MNCFTVIALPDWWPVGVTIQSRIFNWFWHLSVFAHSSSYSLSHSSFPFPSLIFPPLCTGVLRCGGTRPASCQVWTGRKGSALDCVTAVRTCACCPESQLTIPQYLHRYYAWLDGVCISLSLSFFLSYPFVRMCIHLSVYFILNDGINIRLVCLTCLHSANHLSPFIWPHIQYELHTVLRSRPRRTCWIPTLTYPNCSSLPHLNFSSFPHFDISSLFFFHFLAEFP